MKINTELIQIFWYFEKKLIIEDQLIKHNNHDNNATLKIKIPYIFSEIMAQNEQIMLPGYNEPRL